MTEIKIRNIPEGYYLDQQCNVYDANKDKYLNSYKNRYYFKDKNNCRITIAKKTLSKLVLNKIYCIDDIEDLQGQQWRQYKDSQYWVSNKGDAFNSAIVIVLTLFP